VFAASLANGGSLDDIQPGIDYFTELAEMGNLVPVSDATSALTTGEAAVVFDWDYNWAGRAEQSEKDGVNFETIVLEDGGFGNDYTRRGTLTTRQPNAARRWVDRLTSDEGSEQYALRGAIPARLTGLAEAGKLSGEGLDNLPDPEILDKVELPTPEQGDAA